MAKTETLKIRMALEAEGEGILSAPGLDTTGAVTLFFRQIVTRRGLPLKARIPNDETPEAFREARETPAAPLLGRENRHSGNAQGLSLAG